MKSVTLATIVLSTLAGSLLQTGTSASPPADGPRGRGCNYSVSSDPSPEAGDDAMTGQVNAGPMLADAGGTLRCIIRVNVNSQAGGGVAADVSCPADPNGGVIVCATTVDYTSGEDDQDYLCMSYRKPDGSWLYWHPYDHKGDLDWRNDEPGHWTSTSDQPCTLPLQITGPGPDPVFLIDALTCPEIAAHAGVGPNNTYLIDWEGDILINLHGHGPLKAHYEAHWENELIWDCPLYTFYAGNADLFDGGVVDWEP